MWHSPFKQLSPKKMRGKTYLHLLKICLSHGPSFPPANQQPKHFTKSGLLYRVFKKKKKKVHPFYHLLSISSAGLPRTTTPTTPRPCWKSGSLSCRNITIMSSGDQWTSPRESSYTVLMHRTSLQQWSRFTLILWRIAPPLVFFFPGIISKDSLKCRTDSNIINEAPC